MKVAICFCGNVGAFYSNKKQYVMAGDIDYRIGFEHWKKYVFDLNDVDVFIHSWSTKYEKGLVDIYKPKKYLIEEQKSFNAVGISKLGSTRKEFMISRWYSAKESIRLKAEYEKEKNIEYDLVVLARTDWAWLVDIDFSTYKDTNLFYSPDNSNFMPDNPRLDDWIFFSNSKNMNKFSELYEKMYIETGAVKNPIGIIDSHSDTYTHAKNCNLDIVMIENLRDGVEGTPVRALYENCKYSEDYHFSKLKILPDGRQSKRF
jgi:hypothetical protein